MITLLNSYFALQKEQDPIEMKPEKPTTKPKSVFIIGALSNCIPLVLAILAVTKHIKVSTNTANGMLKAGVPLTFMAFTIDYCCTNPPSCYAVEKTEILSISNNVEQGNRIIVAQQIENPILAMMQGFHSTNWNVLTSYIKKDENLLELAKLNLEHNPNYLRERQSNQLVNRLVNLIDNASDLIPLCKEELIAHPNRIPPQNSLFWKYQKEMDLSLLNRKADPEVVRKASELLPGNATFESKKKRITKWINELRELNKTLRSYYFYSLEQAVGGNEDAAPLVENLLKAMSKITLCERIINNPELGFQVQLCEEYENAKIIVEEFGKHIVYGPFHERWGLQAQPCN